MKKLVYFLPVLLFLVLVYFTSTAQVSQRQITADKARIDSFRAWKDTSSGSGRINFIDTVAFLSGAVAEGLGADYADSLNRDEGKVDADSFYTKVQNDSAISSISSDTIQTAIRTGTALSDSLAEYITDGISVDSLVYYGSFDYDASDQSGNGNDGVVTGSANGIIHKTEPDSFKNGIGAYKLNYSVGVDSGYVNIDAAVGDLSATTIGTWEAWIKMPDATPSSNNIIVCFGDVNATEYINLFVLTTGKVYAVIKDAGLTQWALTTDNQVIFDDTWTHVALVQDGGITSDTISIYVNGIKPAQTFEITTDRASWFFELTGIDNGRIACANYNNAGNYSFFTGIIDESKIYKRALSASEIRNNYYNSDIYNLQLTKATYDSLFAIFENGDIDSLNFGSGDFIKYKSGKVTFDSSIVVAKSVTGSEFIQSSKLFIGEGALEKLKQITYKEGTENKDWAELDHKSLPEGVYVKRQKYMYKDKINKKEYELDGVDSLYEIQTEHIVLTKIDTINIMQPDSIIETSYDTTTTEYNNVFLRDKETNKKYYSRGKFIRDKFDRIIVEADGENLSRLVDMMMKAIIELSNKKADKP